MVSDLDGTLLKKDKTISPENKKAMEYFMANGGIFSYASGRIPVAVGHVCKQVMPNAPCICSNGGAIYDFSEKRLISSVNLSWDALEIVRYAEREIPEMGIELCASDKIYFIKKNSSTEKHRRNEFLDDITCSLDCVPEPVLKVLFADENEANIERLIELIEKHPLAEKFTLVRTHEEYYEILPKGINKGDGIGEVCKMLPSVTKTIAVGDNENDIPMYLTADISVAVANASAKTKERAKYVTVTNEQHAIAAIINDIESGVIEL